MAFTIDPRVADVLGHDAHLPPVDPTRFTREALVHRFQQPPTWQPDIEVEKWYRAPNPVAASVLVPLVMHSTVALAFTSAGLMLVGLAAWYGVRRSVEA